jgi:hypothetical protein
MTMSDYSGVQFGGYDGTSYGPRMTVLGTGNVGIGTTSPTAKLDVKGDGAEIYLKSADYSVARIIPRGTGTNVDKGLFSLFDTGVENVRIDTEGSSWFNGGNVGIGTTGPSKQFTVRSLNNSTNAFAGFYALNESQGLEIGYAGIYSGGTNANVDMNIQAKGTGNILMTGSGNVGIGNTGPNYKLTVAGGIEAGGVVTYSKVAGSLDTTGYAIAGLGTVFNGASAFFTFTASGGTGQYQRIVYSCAGVGTNWVVYKVIDEGTNVLDIEASATSAATIVFTFKTRSGTQAYSPRVVIEATGHSIISTYA